MSNCEKCKHFARKERFYPCAKCASLDGLIDYFDEEIDTK